MITKLEKYNLISEKIKNCKSCDLCKTSIQAVVGDGNINAKVVFIGEAPGKKEDEVGKPFVGRSGKLLDSCLNEIGLVREDVWIGNLIKHRPPKNRDPLPNEIEACKNFLTSQLELINPDIVVTLGRFPFNYFFPDAKISSERGKLKKYENYQIFPIYHPAAALRNKIFLSAFKYDFFELSKLLKDKQ